MNFIIVGYIVMAAGHLQAHKQVDLSSAASEKC